MDDISEKRLHIAAILMSGILANPNFSKEYYDLVKVTSNLGLIKTKEEYAATKALEATDILLNHFNNK